MVNEEINQLLAAARKKGVSKWMVAGEVGVADTTFSKWLRYELSETRKAEIIVAIERLTSDLSNGGDTDGCCRCKTVGFERGCRERC